MREQLKKAYPAVPDSFDAAMRQTLEHLAARKVRRGLKPAVAVVLAAVLAVSGLAFAASKSALLQSLFRDGDPTPQAEHLLTQMDVASERDGVRLSIDEYLLDGADLYVRWTATSLRDEPLMLMVSDLETDQDAYPIDDDNMADWRFAHGVLLDAEHPSYSAASRLHFESSAPSEAFEVALTAAFLRPIARILDEESAQDFSGIPSLMRCDCGDCAILYAASARETQGDGWNVDSGLDGFFDGDWSMDGMLNGMEELGYASEALRLPVRFTVVPDAEHIVHTTVDGSRTFIFDRYIMVINRADFTAAGVDIRYSIHPRDGANLSNSFGAKLWFDVLPNGRAVNNAFMQSKSFADNRITGEIVARASSTIPDWVRLVPYSDETGQQFPQYAVEFRLREK